MGIRRRKKLLKLGVSLLVLAIVLYLNRNPKVTEPMVNTPVGGYRVTEFVDGDTVKVDMNGTNETIRMIGVDTPETHDPRKPVQCFGQAAAEFTKKLIGNNYVRLEPDALSANRDRYQRLLRFVYLPDGRLVNEEIIKQGYGFAYLSFPFTKSDQFHASEIAARTANLGLWGTCQITDVNGRSQSEGLSP